MYVSSMAWPKPCMPLHATRPKSVCVLQRCAVRMLCQLCAECLCVCCFIHVAGVDVGAAWRCVPWGHPNS